VCTNKKFFFFKGFFSPFLLMTFYVLSNMKSLRTCLKVTRWPIRKLRIRHAWNEVWLRKNFIRAVTSEKADILFKCQYGASCVSHAWQPKCPRWLTDENWFFRTESLTFHCICVGTTDSKRRATILEKCLLFQQLFLIWRAIAFKSP